MVKHIVVALAAVVHPDTNASDWPVGTLGFRV